MRPIRILGLSALVSYASFAALTSLAAPAFAEEHEAEHFSVKAEHGEIEVTPAKGWHINKEYSWAIKQGDTKVKAKDDFKLEERAKVTGVPAGEYLLKGAVCSENNCAPFVTKITVK